MKIEELGARLRELRTATGRTIASVAADAGLSVPYIANLENGRGNPTWSAVERLAEALGTELRADLVERREPGLPDSLLAFAEGPRFRAATRGLDRTAMMRAMAALAAVATDAPSELDWNRLLDAVVLIRQHRA